VANGVLSRLRGRGSGDKRGRLGKGGMRGGVGGSGQAVTPGDWMTVGLGSGSRSMSRSRGGSRGPSTGNRSSSLFPFSFSFSTPLSFPPDSGVAAIRTCPSDSPSSSSSPSDSTSSEKKPNRPCGVADSANESGRVSGVGERDGPGVPTCIEPELRLC
jgi:hypothetical protein